MKEKIISKLKLIFIPCEENKYRPKFLDSQFLVYYTIFIIVLKLIIIPFFIFFPKSIFFAAITKNAIIEFTNQKRESLGLPSLKENSKLDEAAYLKAKDILEKDYFSHQSPDGISPWYWFKKVGYNYQFAGENLAIGFLDSEEVIQAWFDSPSHKKNLLEKNYEEIGVAVMSGEFEGNKTTVVVQLFGKPKFIQENKEGVSKITQPKKKEMVIIQSKETTSTEPITSTTSIASTVQTATTEVAAATTVAKEEVLTEKKEEKRALTKENLVFNFLQFISLKYSDFLQKAIYASLIFIIISLMINIFVRIDIQHDDLILKTVAFILLLTLFIHLDKGLVIKLIPHNFNIYSWRII